jgi:hypothetical protein
VRYVEGLIGADTINTVPDATWLHSATMARLKPA